MVECGGVDKERHSWALDPPAQLARKAKCVTVCSTHILRGEEERI